VINEVKQSLDDMAKYLFEFVSTDEEEEENNHEHAQEAEAVASAKTTGHD
jgi:hypothetical protein